MKKLIVSFVLLLVAGSPVYAQQELPAVWMEGLVQHHFMVNRWHADKPISDMLPSGITDLGMRINVPLSSKLGIWGQGSLIIPSGTDLRYNSVAPLNGWDFGNYYVTNKKRYENDLIGIRLMAGAFYIHQQGKWSLTPYLGAGITSIPVSYTSYILKEKDTNNTYIVNNGFRKYNRRDIYFYDYVWLSFVSAEVKAEYALSKNWGLSFGLIFQQYLRRVNFNQNISDYYYYTRTTISNTSSKGRFANSLGVSVGLTFKTE